MTSPAKTSPAQDVENNLGTLLIEHLCDRDRFHLAGERFRSAYAEEYPDGDDNSGPLLIIRESDSARFEIEVSVYALHLDDAELARRKRLLERAARRIQPALPLDIADELDPQGGES